MINRVAAVTIIAAVTSVASASARAQQLCMTADEMREAVESGLAVPAVTASRAARTAAAGEVVRIRLCRDAEKVMYHVTTLRRDGRVAHVTIDGVSGNVAAVK